LIIFQLVKKFSAFCGTRERRGVRHCTPSTHLNSAHALISLRSTLMLSFHLGLSFPGDLFHSVFQYNFVCICQLYHACYMSLSSHSRTSVTETLCAGEFTCHQEYDLCTNPHYFPHGVPQLGNINIIHIIIVTITPRTTLLF
jgi:hypothetical protein